jgi:hypothetical protein
VAVGPGDVEGGGEVGVVGVMPYKQGYFAKIPPARNKPGDHSARPP